MLTISLSCQAGTSAAAHDVPDLSPSLGYAVSGSIEPHCEFSSTGGGSVSIDVQDLSDDTLAGGSVSLPFELECNSPFQVSLSSKNGALEFGASPSSDRAFAQRLDYHADLRFSGHGSVLGCTSDGMAAGAGCEHLMQDRLVNRYGSIEIEVPPRDVLLLAGTYEDEITIRITPRLGGED